MSLKTFNEYLTETSLSRVWDTFTNPDIVAGIMSASRQERSPRENAAATLELSWKVRAAGYGFVYVDGHWVEMGPTGLAKPVDETSIVIRGGAKDNGRLKGYLRKWMAEYDQEGVIFKPEGETYVILMTENGTETRIGRFHPDRAADMMTKLRGNGERSFVFESAYESMGFMGRLLKNLEIAKKNGVKYRA
jgi:hypothetical protein